MPAITVILEDPLLEKVNNLVDRRKLRAISGPDEETLREARKIAKSKGQAAANRYLQAQRGPRVSRMGVLIELIDAGLQSRPLEDWVRGSPKRPAAPRKPGPVQAPQAGPKNVPQGRGGAVRKAQDAGS